MSPPKASSTAGRYILCQSVVSWIRTRFSTGSRFMVNPSCYTALGCQAERDGFTKNRYAAGLFFFAQRAFAAFFAI